MTMQDEQPTNQQIFDVLTDIQKRLKNGEAVMNLEDADDHLYAALLRIAQIEHILSEPEMEPESILGVCGQLRDNIHKARAQISDYEDGT